MSISLYSLEDYLLRWKHLLSLRQNLAVNLEDEDMAASIFIRKKPLGMKVTPEMASYRVKYP